MKDARILAGAGAHRNACYLSGYVIECTVKALLRVATGTNPRFTHDLEDLHQEVIALSILSNAFVARYPDPTLLAPVMLTQIAPPSRVRGRTQHHCHWDPLHRYDGSRWNLAGVSQSYLKEADSALDVLIQMLVDGAPL